MYMHYPAYIDYSLVQIYGAMKRLAAAIIIEAKHLKPFFQAL